MDLTVGEALKKGIEAHKNGQLQEAERLYSTILNVQPNHADANHNMGVLAVGVGKTQQSLPFFKAATAANPKIVQFWLSYINALIKLDRTADALVLFELAKKYGAKGEAFDLLEQRLSTRTKKLKDPSPEQLQSIINIYTQGLLKKALSECNKMLKKFPGSVVLYNILGASHVGLMQFDAAIVSYQKALKIKPDYAEAYYNMGIALDNKGDLEASIKSYKKAIKFNPEYADAYNNLGFAMNHKGFHDAAIDSYKKAININPNNAQAYNNMGNTFKNKGDLKAAIQNYSQAVRIKPDYGDAYNNMGGALEDAGDTEAALKSYKHAIKVKPDFAEAHYNMGFVLDKQSDPEDAVDSYSNALKLKPNYAEAQANLVSLLTTFTPRKENQNLIVLVNKAVRKIDLKSHDENIISDEQVIDLCLQTANNISTYGLEIKTKLSQTYRRNSVDLNCSRHFSIFYKHGVIPKFCFGCYKVQVAPRSLIELIKLFFVFDQLELEDNNTRKCMVELRPTIPGFYKGLIYCSSLKQANQIAGYLDQMVLRSIGPGLTAKVKRGCSEYPVSFPEYKQINNVGPQLMNYNEDWKVIEEEHDRKNPMPAAENRRPNLSGLNLRDVLIIQKWVDYARGIGDTSADLINQNPVCYQGIYQTAQARLKNFNFSD